MNGIPLDKEFYIIIGRKQYNTMTLLKQTSLFTEEALTSSREVFLVNRTAWQESDSEKKMNATCGHTCLEQFKKFDRVGLWAKMFSDLLIGMEGWYSRKCKLTWKLKGTKYNRMYFQLQPSTLRTEETGFGLLPTPRAMEITEKDTAMISQDGKKVTRATGETFSTNLTSMAKFGLLPTPTAAETIEAKHPREVIMMGNSPRVVNKQGTNGQAKLNDMARVGMLPTPRARAAGGNCSNDRGKGNLEDVIAEVHKPNGGTSQLNPRFVAEMMGFPPDWTILPFLSGETNPSKDMETL